MPPDIHAPAATPFPIKSVRDRFPAIARAAPFIYFDNAGGAQAPQTVLDAVARQLLDSNVQRGARYAMSMAVDEMIAGARSKVACLVGADDPDEVAFGMNATSFIRLVSLALGQTLSPPRDEIIVTDMDHHANISTWQELTKTGAKIRWWRMREDKALHVEDLVKVLSDRTRLVAFTATSHAMGTRVDVAAAATAAHAAGADAFVDCVHFAPHGLIDVKAWGCDYLVCSGYKAFAPHMGFLWGKRAALERLPTFREEFIPDAPPHKIEAGTLVFENVAGMAAAVGYFESLGVDVAPLETSPRGRIVAALGAIEDYERTLSRAMLSVLSDAGARIHGVANANLAHTRVPTFCFSLPGVTPADAAQTMADADIGIRDGHMYAPRLMERLGLPLETGAIRASLLHYNTLEEVARFGEVLGALIR